MMVELLVGHQPHLLCILDLTCMKHVSLWTNVNINKGLQDGEAAQQVYKEGYHAVLEGDSVIEFL